MAKLDFTVGKASAGGTSLQGYVDVPFSRLVEVFGEPGEGDGHKVAFEWDIEFSDGTIATIYDYKASSLYDSDGLTPDAMRSSEFSDWHVGGVSRRAVKLVEAALEIKPNWTNYGDGLRAYQLFLASARREVDNG